MADKVKTKVPKRNLKRLFSILGTKFPEDMPRQQKVQDVQINSFSKYEMRYLPGFQDKRMAPYINQQPVNVSQLTSYLSGIAQTGSNWAQQAEAIRVLTPEIDQAAQIMVSSILSPTDLQTESIAVVCQNSDLGQDIESKIGQELTNFFNKHVDINARAYNYIRDSLYGSGSDAILILPQHNINILNKAVDADLMRAGIPIGKRYRKDTRPTNQNQVKQTYSNEVFGSYEYLSPSTEQLEALDNSIEEDFEASLEKHNPMPNYKVKDIITNSRQARHKIRELFDNNHNAIVVSSDITSIGRRKDLLTKKTDKISRQIENNFLFDQTNPAYLIDAKQDLYGDKNPAIVQIPTQAVVPVIIPGAPEKHIGYFILVDQWGTPIINSSADNQTTFGPRKLTEAATQAAFGSPNLYKFASTMTDEQRYDITSNIFGVTLKRLLQSKLDDYGLAGTTIQEHDSITTCIFRHLLKQKKCALVFVPEQLMVYFRFDHRPDGTGKSIPESMSTMLALRTVLLMSYIMAATENSIDNKTITVSVDEKQTNVKQYLDMIRNAYINKKMMRFDVNPLTVQQDLIQKSLTILPKGIKGLQDSLDVQTEHKSTGAVMPDNDLMEKLTNWIITWLQVPPSALNKLSENEYAASVATTNLFFNNNIRNKQKVVIKHMSKFVQLYAKYSSYVHRLVKDIIAKALQTQSQNQSTESDKPPKSDIAPETNNDGLIANVNKAISCLKISLPIPKIVVDKSQYEQIDSYIETVDKILNTLYSDDMLPGTANQKLNDMVKSVRASIKEKMVRDYISSIGFQSTYAIPFPYQIDVDNIKDVIQLYSNQRKGLQDWMVHIADKAKTSAEDEQGQGGESSDMGGSTGGNEGGEGGAQETNFDDFGNMPSFDEQTGGEQNPGKQENNESNIKQNETDFDNMPEPPSF